MHNGETLNPSPLSFGTRYESLRLLFLFSIVQENISNVKSKKNKSINIGKEKSDSSCTEFYSKIQWYTQKSTVTYK